MLPVHNPLFVPRVYDSIKHTFEFLSYARKIMDEQVKICPECKAEYYAHITKCRSCDVALVSPETAHADKMPAPQGELVCIEQGAYERILEFATLLESSGIGAKALNIRPGNSCSSEGGFGLFVQQSLAPASVKIIEDFCERVYPGMREAQERLAAGLCPACGADIKNAVSECPDCGLSLSNECGDTGCGNGCSH
jgi:hypothetical protein